MNEFLTFSFFFVLAVAMTVAYGRRTLGTRESRLLVFAMVAHSFSAIAQVVITRDFYGGGDMFLYYRQGLMVREFVLDDFVRNTPVLLGLIFQTDSVLPFYIIGEGSTTGAMTGFAALFLIIAGGSLYGASLLAGVVALLGQASIYQAFRPLLPQNVRLKALAAILLMPSVVYWTSTLLKEAVAMGGVGLLVFAVVRFLFPPRSWLALPAGLLGGVLLASVKAYFIFPLVIAAGAWVVAAFWQTTQNRRERTVARGLVLVFASGIALLMILQVGQAFPRYSLDNVSAAAADSREQFYRTEGGSNIRLEVDRPNESPTDTLQILPMAILTSLFRPLVIEAHNATSLVNSFEMLALLILLLVGIKRRGLAGVKNLVRDSPLMIFLLVFVITSGVAIGISAPNLGSLSRYRAPMMPMYLLFVVLVIPASNNDLQRTGSAD